MSSETATDFQSAKSTFVEWIKLLRSDTARYYFSKALDLFMGLPLAHQGGLLQFVVNQIDEPKLRIKVQDNSQFVGAMRSILFYYTGNLEFGQPSRSDFESLLTQYIRSPAFKINERTGHDYRIE